MNLLELKNDDEKVNKLPKERELHVHVEDTTDDLHTQRTAAKHYTLCQISDFHCSVVHVFAFPGLYAALVGSFRSAYWSHFQESSSPHKER
jgi:hypothetical protein